MKKILLAGILTVVTLAAASPLRAYVISSLISTSGTIVPTKWESSSFPLTWQMNPTVGSNVTGTDRTQAQVFAASFASWQALATASVSFTQGANISASAQTPTFDKVNSISTNPADATTIPVGVLALTQTYAFSSTGVDTFGRIVDFPGQILEADIWFSGTQPFSTNNAAVAGRVDLQAVTTHEIGHFLGLDHSPLLSATMFPSVGPGIIYPRTQSADDIAAMSLLYPSALFASKGSISGTIRTTANVPVYGAVVVAVNANGLPVASSVTDPAGAYTIQGLDAGAYTVYAEPLDGPMTIGNIGYSYIYPSAQVNNTFTTRFR